VRDFKVVTFDIVQSFLRENYPEVGELVMHILKAILKTRIDYMANPDWSESDRKSHFVENLGEFMTPDDFKVLGVAGEVNPSELFDLVKKRMEEASN
jgi:hypothetical protein